MDFFLLNCMIVQIEVILGENQSLVGQVSMVVGISIIMPLVAVEDIILHPIMMLLKLHPLTSEHVRLLCFEIDCLL